MTEKTHDPFKELSEIRNQLSYSKRIGFLFGAGTSKALGISDVAQLTKKVESSLTKEESATFKSIKDDLAEKDRHIEAILNQTRLIRQITGDSAKKDFGGIDGIQAKNLDKSICDNIYDILSAEEKNADISVAKQFLNWLNWLPRDFPKELFTTNYDLIIEKSAEDLLIPFYDGFLGSNEPFFHNDSVESVLKLDAPPLSWIRLWKLHGSLCWFWKLNEDDKVRRIVRLSAGSREKFPDAELVIYPSHDKYESSRKQPFIGYFDRLKAFLNQKEGIFIISGYSFSDEHINEIIFNGLRHNNRLHMIVFFFDDDPLERIVAENRHYPNLTLIGRKKASIAGMPGKWDLGGSGDLVDAFWDEGGKEVKLGDFKELVRFLCMCSGVKYEIQP